MSTVSKVKVRYIKKRLQPASKEVYDKVQFADTPEEIEKRRAAEAVRIEQERKAADEKRKLEEAEAKKKADADALKKQQDADALKKQQEEEAKNKAAQHSTPKKEETKVETAKEDNFTTAYKPPVYKGDTNFKLAESVFNKFKVPDPDDFKAMLEADFKNSRLANFFPTPEDMSKMKTFMLDQHYYSRLIAVHRYYQSQSNFPQIGFNDAMNLFKATKAFDAEFDQSRLSVIFAETNATGALKGNADKDLDRFEFVELVIRAAIVKYKHSNKVQKHREAVFKFLEHDFLPFAKSSEEDYNQFRIEKIWTPAVNKVLHTNKTAIDKLFVQVGGNDGSCDLKEVLKMVKGANLSNVSNREVTWCFSMSQMAVIDETKGGYTKMDKKEFYEFLVRVAAKQYEGKKDALDVMLSNTLKSILK